MVRKIVLLFLIVHSYSLFGLNFYWVGGSGSWTDINHWATTSGGSVKHIHAPNSSDNVFFDANSSTSPSVINVNTPTIICNTLDVSGLSNTFSFVGICKEIKIFGSLKLGTNANWGMVGGKFSFESQQTNNVISSNHSFMPLDMQFNGINGGWTLTDSLYTFRKIYHNAGSLNTAGNKVFIYAYYSSSAISRDLILGNSVFSCFVFDVDDMGFTVTAGTSKIVILGSIFSITNCGNQSFYDLEGRSATKIYALALNLQFHDVRLRKSSIIHANCTYNTLYFYKGQNYIFGPNTSQTFNTDFVANGNCSKFITIYGSGSTFTKSNSSIDLNYVLLSQCISAGGATFNAWSSVDNGGNTGWNIQPLTLRNLYWVGGNGHWEDSLHWATSSGGFGGECIPRAMDNVFFDNNSFTSSTDSVIITDTAGVCGDMIWNTTTNPVFYGDNKKKLKISGSLDFCSSMDMKFLGEIIFNSNQSAKHIQTSNFTFQHYLTFNGKGSWILLDSLKSDSTINIFRGNLNFNNQYVHCTSLRAVGYQGKKLFLTQSRIDIENQLLIHQDSCFINPGTSVIHLYSSNDGIKTVNMKQRRLWTVIYEADSIDFYPKLDLAITFIHKLIYRGNIIKSGILSTDSIFYAAGHDYILKGIDTINDYLRANGYCTKKINIRNADPMLKVYIHKNTGNISVNNINMRGVNTSGNATFIANNSSDLGNNAGWTFSNIGTKYYWVGDSGDWNDSLHWATSSGGSGGACIPTIYDSVYFDSNSFSSTGKVVEVSYKTACCRDMIWDTLLPNPKFRTAFNNSFYISGNLNLSPNMDFESRGNFYFCDTTKGKHIISNNQDFDSLVYFIDTGEWVLYDQMNILKNLHLNTGILNTNGHDLLISGSLIANTMNQKSLDISNSTLLFNDSTSSSHMFWFQTMNNSHLNTSHSKVIFKGINNILSLSGFGTANLNHLYFSNPKSSNMFLAANGLSNFNAKVVFRGSAEIYGDHSYDTLIFAKKSRYILGFNSHQYINYLWQAIGYCGQSIDVKGYGGQAYIHKSSGIVEVRNVNLKNIVAQGNAVFSAYGGKDLGGNSQWNFIPNTPRTLYWIGGKGHWNDSLHWSLSSGGLGGECFPISTDDVYVDINSPLSGSFDSLSINISGECHNLNWSSVSSVVFGGSLDVYGGINITPKLKTQDLRLSFLSHGSNNNIKTGDNSMKAILFDGSGAWNMNDSLISLDSIIFLGGTLSTQNHNMAARVFYSDSIHAQKILNLGSSKIGIRSQWILNTDSLILNADSSEIFFEKGNTYSIVHTGKGNIAYNNILVFDENTGHTIFVNSDTAHIHFNKIIVYNSTDFYNHYSIDSLIFAPGNTYKFQANQTQKINKYWYIRGNNCFAINLESTIMYYSAFLSLDSAKVEGDFINMRDINALGNTPFYAGKYSSDIDNNSGWLFQNSNNYNYGLGPDTSFVIGKNIVINTSNFNTTPSTLYLWSTGSTHDTIVANKTGWYYVTITYGGNCSVTDSLYIGCNIQLNYNITHPHCYGDTNGQISIIIPDTTYSYSILWGTGDTNYVLSQYPAGLYSLSISTDSGRCILIDTIALIDPQELKVKQGDTSFCQGDSVLLNLGDFSKYFWSDSLHLQKRWIAIPDTFRVMVEDSIHCQSAQDTIIILQDERPVVFLGNDTTICKNTSVINLSPGNYFDTYLWSDNSTMDYLDIYNPGTYWVKTTLKSCVIFDTILVNVCPSEIDMPNIFTPNGDGYNDILRPNNLNITSFNMKIYNRWGNEIYHTENIRKGWDGTYKSHPVAEGVYFYVIEYRPWTGKNINEIKIARGTITLMRYR